jgi:hypothetical protein
MENGSRRLMVASFLALSVLLCHHAPRNGGFKALERFDIQGGVISKFLTLALRLMVHLILPRQAMNAHSRRIQTNQSTLRGVRISAGYFECRAPA